MTNVFLVMATARVYDHKQPIPLRAFPERAQADEWRAELIDYHISPPAMPAGDDAALWKGYDAQMTAWRNAHPAGVEASHYQSFGVYDVPFGLKENSP